MNKYEKYGGMTSDDLTETCISLEKERDELKVRDQDIKESIIAWIWGEKYMTPQNESQIAFNMGIDKACKIIEDSLYKKSTLRQELQTLKELLKKGGFAPSRNITEKEYRRYQELRK